MDELNSLRERLMALQKKLSAYNHAIGLIDYDGVTGAPKATAANRGETLGILGEEVYKLSTGPETIELLDALHERESELDEKTSRMVFLMRKDLEEMRKIPMEEYLAHQKLVNDASAVWHEAKEKSDYALFEPYLARMVESLKKIAGYVAPEKKAYDYWLNNFEDGLDMARCEQFFSALRDGLTPLVKRVGQARQVDDSFLHGDFPLADQRTLSDKLMEMMCIDRTHCGIAETEHPFTTNFTRYDVRITTHYLKDNFASSMYSVIHEGGHALYELSTAEDLAYTCLGTGVSMGIHESQSRFYENIIGRSRPFIHALAPTLKKLFPQLAAVSEEQLYLAFNRSEPSLIRTEADELTYSFHIMIRYELEKRLFAGELTTRELPAEWNRLYKEYLGVDVPDDRSGVLQDSHWSGGGMGYFPSYALGSAYGAQMLRKMKETLDVDQCVREGNLKPVNEWLEEHVWKYGSLYKPSQVLDRALGEPFDPACYVQYLTDKYTDVYGL